jgi:hypothetical protein
LRALVSVGDRLGGELGELVVRQQHHVDRFRKHHHRRRGVAELHVLLGADGLVEGDGPVEIPHGKVDEDHSSHFPAPFESLFDPDAPMSYKRQL